MGGPDPLSRPGTGHPLVTLVLDAGGVTALARERARLRVLRDRDQWPAQVPAVVLAEALTGDHRRDHATNRLLRACQIRPVTELQARAAAALRAATGRAGEISGTDAIVAAVAVEHGHEAIVLTSDPRDLRDLTAHSTTSVTVVTA